MAQARRTSRVARSTLDPWLLRLRILAIVAVFVMAAGTFGYVVVEGWTVLDALYMVLITLTTVGFGEVRELDTSGRVLTIGILLAGVVLVATTVAFVAQVIQEGVLGERGKQRRMQKRIDHFRNHYIVCGFGRVGRAVTHQLAEEGADFVVIDRGERDAEDVRIEAFPWEIGDATDEDVLRAAGVERARGIVCALPEDPDNVFIALAARSLNPQITIVSRVSDPHAIARLEQAGVHRIISPYETSGRQMALAAMEKV